MEIPDGLAQALNFGLVDAVLSRRSRRFGLGMSLPEGALAHTSSAPPIPLGELEEAFLVWLGTGATGLALGDLPRHGLEWMHAWGGRSWPCSCNSHSTELFYTNDSGLYLVRPEDAPDPGGIAPFAGRTPEETLDLVLKLFRASSRRIEDGRADLPDGEPGLFRFNAWNANRPGTTLFIPVTNTTIEYMTLLFIYFDEAHRFSVVDEHSGNARCGLDRWLAAGRLGRDVELSLIDLELRVLTTLNVEQAFISQNMSLAMQALGLGGWTFTGFLPHHVLGASPAHRGLGFDIVTPARTPRHVAAAVPVGRAGVMEGLCPPYVASMDEAVDRFLAMRASSPGQPTPYNEPAEVMTERGGYSEETIEIVKAFCTYVHETHGRFPAFVDPMFVRLVLQAHHLELPFYDRHYREGAYASTHRDHFRLWHPDRAAEVDAREKLEEISDTIS